MRTVLRINPLRALLALFFATAIIATTTDTADAYNLEGAKWYGTPSSGCCGNIHVSPNGWPDSSGLSTFSPVDSNALQAAVNAWNGSAANVYLQFLGGNLKAYDTSCPTCGWDGLTQYSQSGGAFNYANLNLNGYWIQGYNAAEAQGVAAHELGHAMGIDHVTFCALMYPTTPRCNIANPTTDDINGINALY